MTLSIFTGFEDILIQQFGNLVIVALGIIVLLSIGFLIIQLDFRILTLVDTILIIGFSRMGWIPSYVEGIAWVLIVGVGIYISWGFLDR